MITSFKYLKVWERADQLAHKIFDMTEAFPKVYLYDLVSQLRRAALSIPTNIAEGCASVHSSEFLQFLNIARRSLSETQYLVGFAFRRRLIQQAELLELESLFIEISKMLNSLMASIRRKKRPLSSLPLTTQHLTLPPG
ncbi:MAG: four helix bundle protein [Candidatus Methylomirabilis sp.]|nr:four helix bundle protein [Candidatus Methylomirabilis sp.]